MRRRRLRAMSRNLRADAHQLGGRLSENLKVELVYLPVTFEKTSPTRSELQVVQAELVGWPEGYFDGIAAATMNQQTDTSERWSSPMSKPTNVQCRDSISKLPVASQKS